MKSAAPSAYREKSADERRLLDLMEAVARQRSKTAFAELFQNFAPRLKAYGMRAGADPQTAEELAQEAMIAVWRKADSFDPAKASVATWIFTIVRNKRIDMLRREARPDPQPADFLHLEQDPVAPDEALDAAQLRERIKATLSSLPDEQAEVIKKAYFEDMSHRAISDALDLPLGTVKSRIRLALARIKTAMSGEPS